MQHGLQIDDDGRPQFLCFGFLRLLNVLAGHGISPPEDAPKFVRKWRSAYFGIWVQQLQQTIRKFDIAAEYVGRQAHDISRFVELDSAGQIDGTPIGNPINLNFFAAIEHLPVFLDAMAIYLRMEVDAFARFVYFLYEHGGKLPRDSFREHRKWFLKHRDFDPAYTAILEECTQWFEDLAGPQPEGIRDAIVHYGATHFVGWSREPFALIPFTSGPNGFGTDNTMRALGSITAGWFRFLDRCTSHFASRLQGVVTWADLSNLGQSEILVLNDIERPSDWVYPRFARAPITKSIAP